MHNMYIMVLDDKKVGSSIDPGSHKIEKENNGIPMGLFESPTYLEIIA